MSELSTSDGLTLYYEVQGHGPPVLLLHSLGFDGRLWSETGVVDGLLQNGRSVIVPDARGHGRSDHPADAAIYGVDRFADDVRSLLVQLQIPLIDLASYSFGSFVGLRVLQVDRRIRRAVLGGVGGRVLVNYPNTSDRLPQGPSPQEAEAFVLDSFPYLRNRIEKGDTHPQALIEVLRAGVWPTEKTFSDVSANVLLLCGTADDDPTPLADSIPHATIVRVNADHATTMEHPQFTSTIVSFLSEGDVPPSSPYDFTANLREDSG